MRIALTGGIACGKSPVAQFVALAQKLGTMLITRDKELLKKLPDVVTDF